ncbi:hypothetical protein GS426_21460 [Rhodococcus hoagii]|nr:hypothetical protein [Prescottella equi]
MGDFYRANAGQSIDGWYFKSLADIAEDWETRYDAEVEVHDWSVEGEAPDPILACSRGRGGVS